MSFWSKNITFKKLIIPGIIVLVVFISITYFYYELFRDAQKNDMELRNKIAILENSLASSTHDNTELGEALKSEQDRNRLFSNDIQSIQNTVGTLVKLSETDSELLKKYSKVYFLNENYIPEKLTPIPTNFLSDPKKQLSLNAQTWPFIQKLLENAEKDGVTIKIASAYRSFDEQSNLKATYKVEYGSGANRFSADQGYSEHQLGTTVDFTTPEIGGVLVGFDKTKAYTWLNLNAYKYGFILSYPKENTYYIFEPWHWRFVGVFLATYLHDNGKTFYNLDQRTIDSYLVTLFDEQ